jgi:hypothetical protein
MLFKTLKMIKGYSLIGLGFSFTFVISETIDD